MAVTWKWKTRVPNAFPPRCSLLSSSNDNAGSLSHNQDKHFWSTSGFHIRPFFLDCWPPACTNLLKGCWKGPRKLVFKIGRSLEGLLAEEIYAEIALWKRRAQEHKDIATRAKKSATTRAYFVVWAWDLSEKQNKTSCKTIDWMLPLRLVQHVFL